MLDLFFSCMAGFSLDALHEKKKKCVSVECSSGLRTKDQRSFATATTEVKYHSSLRAQSTDMTETRLLSVLDK